MPDKKRTKKKPARNPAPDKTEKKAQARQWLLALLISVLLVLVVAFFIGNSTLTSSGKESPEALAEAFISSMEHQDKGGLRTCLLSVDANYRKMQDDLFSYIELETGITDIDYDNIVYSVMNAGDDAVAGIEEQMRVSGIQDACVIYFEVPIVREKDGGTYDTVTAYYMAAFMAMDKWYIYDVVKDATYVSSGTDADGNPVDPADSYRLFNNKFVGGDQEIGYIPLDNMWYGVTVSESDSAIEGTEKDLCYVHESGNATIHMVLIETDEEPSEMADRLYDNLSSDETVDAEVMSMEADLNGNPAYHTGFYSASADRFFFSWLVDTREYDGHIRYLTVESTSEYEEASIYLTNFLTPEQYIEKMENMGFNGEDMSEESQDTSGQTED